MICTHYFDWKVIKKISVDSRFVMRESHFLLCNARAAYTEGGCLGGAGG